MHFISSLHNVYCQNEFWYAGYLMFNKNRFPKRSFKNISLTTFVNEMFYFKVFKTLKNLRNSLKLLKL